MGTNFSMDATVFTAPHKWHDNWPDSTTQPKYDPLYGFPKGRKEKTMIATQEEMDSANLELAFRDYCAHEFIKYKTCRRDVQPWYFRCRHAKHSWEECEFQDYLIRMKEWERERRLVARDRRIAKKGELMTE